MLRPAVRLQVEPRLAGLLRVGRRQVESEPMKPLELPQRLVLQEAPEVQQTVPPRPLATVLLEQELAEQELAEQELAEQAMVEQAMVEQRQRAAQVPLEQVLVEQVLVRLRREQPPLEQPELPEPVRLELPRLESALQKLAQQPLVQQVPLQLVQQRQAELRRSEPAHRLDWAERMELRSEYSFSNLTVQRNGDDTPASNPECSEKMLLKTE